METKSIIAAGVACAFFLSAAVSSFGVPIDFDFESEPLGSSLGSLTVSNGGVDLTLSGSGYVVVTDQAAIPSLGSHSVLGSVGSTLASGQFTPLTHTFSEDIASATFLFGDAGGDDDGVVSLSLYDASNVLIVTLTQPYGTSNSGGSITINQTFRSAVFSTDSPPDNLHSLGQEWAAVDVVPEPATLGLLGLISGGIYFARRFFVV
jgi:hypothetical protein